MRENMNREDVLLDMLKKRGEQGVYTNEIADKFKIKKSSATKLTWLLRKKGYIVEFNGKCYVLKGSPSQGNKNSHHIRNVSGGKRAKMDIILQLIKDAGKDGVKVKDLAVKAGVKQNNICFHIFSLRHRHKEKISFRKGRYYTTGSAASAREHVQEHQRKIPVSDCNGKSFVKEMALIMGDDDLLDKIKNLSPEDTTLFLINMKQAVHAKKVCSSILETSLDANNILQELQQDA
jgi:predicted transcriptional regulator